MITTTRLLIATCLAALLGCTPEPDKPELPAEPKAASPAVAADVPARAEMAADQTQSEIALTVYKSPTCGCCQAWVDQMQQSNFALNVANETNMAAVKTTFDIAPDLQSCHTAVTQSGNYFFEGHVPAPAIERFLSGPPESAVGLAVPGMPIGSPGMEMEDQFQPYDVVIVYADGRHEVYERIENPSQQYN